MVSGKYAVLSGAIARQQALANISNNLANVNTTGFRKSRAGFEALLKGSKQRRQSEGINYGRVRTMGIDFTQGPLRQTGRELDVAISGQGFFKVRNNGQFLYTRNGNFYTDQNGTLKTAEGYEVLDSSSQPIQLPLVEGKKIFIDQAGVISVDNRPTNARIQVFTLSDPSRLKRLGASLFQAPQGVRSRPTDQAAVVQKHLEGSNVNMVEEMVLMIDTQRKFESNLKALKNYSKLGEKQSELGTVA